MARCSFGKVVVNEAWEVEGQKPKYPFGTDLDGRFLHINDGNQQWLLAAFDFSYMFRHTSLAWRQAIFRETGIPITNIWVHETQNHSAPVAVELDGVACNRLIDLSLPVIRNMISNTEEAELGYVIADLGERFNMNREQYIPGLGAVTVWAGCEFDENGRPYSQDPSIMLLERWQPDLPAFQKRIYFDRPADPQAALLVFRSKKTKNALGTLTRFAAHADIVGTCATWKKKGDMGEYRYHFDWPGYVRQTIEKHLGGVGVCVCGPCGNISPKKRALQGYEAGDRQAREIGSGVANACLSIWEKDRVMWQPLTLGKIACAKIDLPIRESFPKNRQEIQMAKERAKNYEEKFKSAIKENAPAFHIKQLIDEFLHWSVVPKIVDRWIKLSERELQEHIMTVEIEAVRINDLIFAGLPGESMIETCQWLRAQSLGNRLVVIDQINGYCAYQTTREQYDLGGYSYWCSCLSRDAETMTRQKSLEMIQNV